MNKYLKVLSIDWDYFINANADDRMLLFPDGGNEKLGRMLRNIIWASKYASSSKLSDIEVDTDAIHKVLNIVNNSSAFYLFIADSHRYIYDCIKYVYETRGFAGLEVDNIDYHHDYYNYSTKYEVNCGNWVNALFDVESNRRIVKGKRHLRYRWVSREDSQQSDELLNQPWYQPAALDDLSMVDYDIIFICRSDMWSPPHLDDEFKSTLDKITGTGITKIHLEDIENRYNDELKAIIQNTIETMKKAMEGVQ